MIRNLVPNIENKYYPMNLCLFHYKTYNHFFLLPNTKYNQLSLCQSMKNIHCGLDQNKKNIVLVLGQCMTSKPPRRYHCRYHILFQSHQLHRKYHNQQQSYLLLYICHILDTKMGYCWYSR